MKILKGLWILLLSLFALVCAFVVFCALNPDFTEKVSDFLYSNGINQTEDTRQTESPDALDQITEKEKPDEGIGFGNGDISIDTAPDEVSYIQPNQSELYIPDKVAGRSGYQPIKDEGRQIEEEEAEELAGQIGPGNTGDGLSFDSRFYPYYAMLGEKEKHLYRQIYANAIDLNGSFSPVEEIQVDELMDIFAAVYNDHPELFFMETAYYCKYRRNGQCAEIDLSFNDTAQNLEAARAEFEGRAAEIINGAGGFSDNYSKEKYVHDMLADRISYNTKAPMNQSAYSALINGQTVCAGYARAFQYIMQQLGIPCYYCTGYAGENHAWNIIELDDGYYNVDVTWDDTETGKNYDYFNKTDGDYADTHIRKDMSVNLPPCYGQKYRDLEPNPEENRKTLEELGIPKEAVFNNLSDYYRDCYEQITELGLGSYTFVSVIEGEDLFWQWYDSYQSKACLEGYLIEAMTALGAENYAIIYSAEELEGKQYLITHEVVLE